LQTNEKGNGHRKVFGIVEHYLLDNTIYYYIIDVEKEQY